MSIESKLLDFDKILNRVKSLLKTDSDKEVASAIGMKPNTFHMRKKNNSIPLIEFVKLADSKKVNMNWLIHGEGPLYKDDISTLSDQCTSSEKTIKSDHEGSNVTKVIIEHQDTIKRFKNHEKAKQFNEFLVEIEGDDPEGYDELYREAKAIYKTIKRIKNKQDLKKTPNDSEDIQDKSTA